MNPRLTRQLVAGAGVMLVLLIAGYLFFVLTRAGQQFDNTGYFGRESGPFLLKQYNGEILMAVRVETIVVGACVVLVLAVVERVTLAGIFAVAGMACAIQGAELLKHILPRPELTLTAWPVPVYFKGNTFPSGHTTIGTSIALAILMVLPARFRPTAAFGACLVSASYATAVLQAGWHRPSDALGGIAWSGACMSLAAAGAVATTGFPRLQSGAVPWGGIITFGVASSGAVWAASSLLDSAIPGDSWPFLLLILCIVTSAIALVMWFATRLRGMGWRID